MAQVCCCRSALGVGVTSQGLMGWQWHEPVFPAHRGQLAALFVKFSLDLDFQLEALFVCGGAFCHVWGEKQQHA